MPTTKRVLPSASPNESLSALGASLTAVTAIVLVARFESTSPSLTLNSIVFDATGASFVELKATERSTV